MRVVEVVIEFVEAKRNQMHYVSYVETVDPVILSDDS